MVKQHNGQSELLISWLKDAYAMEKTLVPKLRDHAKDMQHHPEISRRIEQHVEETQRHADLVKGCLERMGADTSATKTIMGQIFGTFQSIPEEVAEDELVKHNLADIAAEHFEIACYQSLIAAAQDVGDAATVEACRQILRDEMDMAQFMEQQLPRTTVEVLHEYAETHSR